MSRYQEFDPLTPEEYAALEADILERGVQVPIVVDEHGVPIDGHHRLMICRRHGITDYPTIVQAGLTDDEKRDYAQSLNCARRSLSREQKRRQIANRLKRHPEHSDRRLAQSLGVDHKTVGSVRAELQSGGEIPRQTVKVGSIGMRYKTPPPPKRLDSAGGEIPRHLHTAFAAQAEHTSLGNLLTDVKRRSGELARVSGPLRARIEQLRHHLDAAVDILTHTTPQTVHAACGGRGCDACDQHGYLTT